MAGAAPVQGGWDTLLWRVDTSRDSYALRLFRPEQRTQCEEEARAMRIVAALGVPVPEVITHGLWGDRPVMLMQWCEGQTVMDAARAHPELTEHLGRSMGRLHARMHANPVPREFWDDHRTWLDKAGPADSRLEARLREAGLHDGYLLHLDFHPLNVLCTDGKASVILDWSGATVGDPRVDVARTMSIFRLVSAPGTPGLSDFTALRRDLERAWLEGYTEVAGPLPDMTLFEIWATDFFIHDMEKKLGMPGFWMTPADFDRLRGYLTALKHRAGVF